MFAFIRKLQVQAMCCDHTVRSILLNPESKHVSFSRLWLYMSRPAEFDASRTTLSTISSLRGNSHIVVAKMHSSIERDSNTSHISRRLGLSEIKIYDTSIANESKFNIFGEVANAFWGARAPNGYGSIFYHCLSWRKGLCHAETCKLPVVLYFVAWISTSPLGTSSLAFLPPPEQIPGSREESFIDNRWLPRRHILRSVINIDFLYGATGVR
jgi:hypothetical protein